MCQNNLEFPFEREKITTKFNTLFVRLYCFLSLTQQQCFTSKLKKLSIIFEAKIFNIFFILWHDTELSTTFYWFCVPCLFCIVLPCCFDFILSYIFAFSLFVSLVFLERWDLPSSDFIAIREISYCEPTNLTSKLIESDDCLHLCMYTNSSCIGH